MEIVDVPSESLMNMEIEPPAKIPRTEAVSISYYSLPYFLFFLLLLPFLINFRIFRRHLSQ